MAEKYGQIQEQTQQLKQGLMISRQQLLQASLVELPVTQLVDRINTEMNDNPALETTTPGDEDYDMGSLNVSSSTDTDSSDEDFETVSEREERQSALDEALSGIGRDDEELPVYQGGNAVNDEREEMVFGETTSFYDQLKEQMGELDMSDEEHDVMEYLIGSLDDDGMLRKPLQNITDELAVYHNIDVSEQEIEQVLLKLQDFDPAGIGARSLQECLLLQVARREPSRLKTLMTKALENYFELFTKKHWHRLQQVLQLNDLEGETLIRELRKLNPKPGAAMSEVVGHSIQQITPDFIVDTQDDGTISFTLNNSDVPELHVSPSFTEILQEYQTNKEHMSQQMKEALLYTRKKVSAAQGFIEAIRVRQHTLTVTMKAIIQWQHRFFEDGEEASLRPMILKDIEKKTGLDVSTISRVSNSKYVQTRWGTFPLRFFFNDAYTTAEGEELSTRKIKAALRELIDSEDKRHPLSDEALRQLLKDKGYPIARRTVAKYREQMGLPIARLRR